MGGKRSSNNYRRNGGGRGSKSAAASSSPPNSSANSVTNSPQATPAKPSAGASSATPLSSATTNPSSANGTALANCPIAVPFAPAGPPAITGPSSPYYTPPAFFKATADHFDKCASKMRLLAEDWESKQVPLTTSDSPAAAAGSGASVEPLDYSTVSSLFKGEDEYENRLHRVMFFAHFGFDPVPTSQLNDSLLFGYCKQLQDQQRLLSESTQDLNAKVDAMMLQYQSVIKENESLRQEREQLILIKDKIQSLANGLYMESKAARAQLAHLGEPDFPAPHSSILDSVVVAVNATCPDMYDLSMFSSKWRMDPVAALNEARERQMGISGEVDKRSKGGDGSGGKKAGGSSGATVGAAQRKLPKTVQEVAAAVRKYLDMRDASDASNPVKVLLQVMADAVVLVKGGEDAPEGVGSSAGVVASPVLQPSPPAASSPSPTGRKAKSKSKVKRLPSSSLVLAGSASPPNNTSLAAPAASSTSTVHCCNQMSTLMAKVDAVTREYQERTITYAMSTKVLNARVDLAQAEAKVAATELKHERADLKMTRMELKHAKIELELAKSRLEKAELQAQAAKAEADLVRSVLDKATAETRQAVTEKQLREADNRLLLLMATTYHARLECGKQMWHQLRTATTAALANAAATIKRLQCENTALRAKLDRALATSALAEQVAVHLDAQVRAVRGEFAAMVQHWTLGGEWNVPVPVGAGAAMMIEEQQQQQQQRGPAVGGAARRRTNSFIGGGSVLGSALGTAPAGLMREHGSGANLPELAVSLGLTPQNGSVVADLSVD